MKIKILLVLIFAFFIPSLGVTQTKKYIIHTVMFYNFENFFDTINQSNFDEEWLPKGVKNWTSKKYQQKLHNLSKVLFEVGNSDNPHNSPTLIGGAEIENRGVLEDLIKEPLLKDKDYGIIHFDSPDKRGIDVALLYQKNHFKPTSYKNIPLLIYKTKKQKKNQETIIKDSLNVFNQKRVYTRDILLVTGLLDGEEINVLVNHWPSRSGGQKKSSPYREAAGILNKKIIDSLHIINPNAKVILMGDLNDSPDNKSIKSGLEAKRFKEEVPPNGIYNPFEELSHNGEATIFYRDAGDIFDQIMVSKSLILNSFSSFQYWKSGIFNKSFLVQQSGQFKGYPKRTTPTEVGFSDHFPVYIYLIKEVN